MCGRSLMQRHPFAVPDFGIFSSTMLQLLHHDIGRRMQCQKQNLLTNMSLPIDIIKSTIKVAGKQKHHLHEPLFCGNEIKYLEKEGFPPIEIKSKNLKSVYKILNILLKKHLILLIINVIMLSNFLIK